VDWQPLYTLPSKIRVTPSEKTSKDKNTKADNKDGEAGHPSTQPVSPPSLPRPLPLSLSSEPYLCIYLSISLAFSHRYYRRVARFRARHRRRRPPAALAVLHLSLHHHPLRASPYTIIHLSLHHHPFLNTINQSHVAQMRAERRGPAQGGVRSR
jgi:hypothetical protein